MRITIAGTGIVGTVLAERLSEEKHNVTVIDVDEEHINYVSNTLDVLAILGDATSAEVLKESDIEKSDVFIAVTDTDEKNLVMCLLARKLGAANTIARIRNSHFSDVTGLIKDELGLSMAINPEYETAREIFSSLKYRSVGQVETFAKGNAELITCAVKPGSVIEGVMVKDIQKVTGCKILICGIKRGGEVYIPNGAVTINAGDKISFVATRLDALHFLQKMEYDTERIKDIVIMGASRLGKWLAYMASQGGIPVKIIDKNRSVCEAIHSEISNAEVICGDATDMDLIDEENIMSASAIVAATEEDTVNAMLAMFVSQKAPGCKMVTKLKKSDFEEILYNMELGSVFNPKYVAADHIVKYVRAMQNSLENEVESICHVIDNKVEVLEFNIGTGFKHLSTPLHSLTFKPDVLVAIIYRNGHTFIPGGDDTIEVGDMILVVTTCKGIGRYNDIFD